MFRTYFLLGYGKKTLTPASLRERYIEEKKNSAIIKDEGYKNKIRITIYRSKAIAPFEIVCGIYGLMFHTVFAKDIADDLVLNEAEFCHSFTDKW